MPATDQQLRNSLVCQPAVWVAMLRSSHTPQGPALAMRSEMSSITARPARCISEFYRRCSVEAAPPTVLGTDVPGLDRLEVVEVDHSLDELEIVRRAAAQEMADQSHEPDAATSGQLTDVTVLPRANRVRLTVADLDEARADELTERHGATHICLLDQPVSTSDDFSATSRPTTDAGRVTDAG